jgi:hypothetical protein
VEIKEAFIDFIPLHSSGVHAVHVNVQAPTFFGIVERVFGYFSYSSHRWNVLKDYQYYSEAPF